MTKPVTLTAAAIKRYAPAKERRRIRDALAKGLFLIIEPSGTKSFQMRFRTPSGRIAKVTLGRADFSGRELEGDPEIGQPLTLPAARMLAAEVHRRRARGEDVVAEEKAKKHRQRTELADRASSSFGAALRDYIREYAQPKTRRWRDTARLLGLRYDADSGEVEEIKDGLAQRWSAKDIRDLDGHDIWAVVDEAKRLGLPGITVRRPGFNEERARKLFMALSALFKWAHKERRIAVNPCIGAYRAESIKARDRVLDADEIRWFWQATETVDTPRVTGFKPILRLLLLTGARLNEVAGMHRSELHSDGMWRLPGERTKNKRAHVVPLPAMAWNMINGMPERGELVFATNGNWSRMKKRLDAAMLAIAKQEKGKTSIPPWRLHDLRRTFVTHLAEMRVSRDVIELAVNHVSGARAGVAGTYNRSELLSERKEALERWALHVQGLVSGTPDNVVPLRKADAS